MESRLENADTRAVLVTGASGFVGRRLTEVLREHGFHVRRALRREPEQPVADDTIVGDMDGSTDFGSALAGKVGTVVHLAARVHVLRNRAADQAAEYHRVNVEGTVRLARQAAAAGVRRFIFLSSIKVNGEKTPPDVPFSSRSLPCPRDPYGVSKWNAELALKKIAAEAGMELVIIRPPLVYGPGVKANFKSMMSLLSRRIPLPLAGITGNRRSLVALDNLVDLIRVCVMHPNAANQTFLVSDGEDLSTADLLARLGDAIGKPARLFFLPDEILKIGAALMNKSAVYSRLCGSLTIDIDRTRNALNWRPPISVAEGLRRVVAGSIE